MMRLREYMEDDIMKIFSNPFINDPVNDIKKIETYYDDIVDNCFIKSSEMDYIIDINDRRQTCTIRPYTIEYDDKKGVYNMTMVMSMPYKKASTLGIFSDQQVCYQILEDRMASLVPITILYLYTVTIKIVHHNDKILYNIVANKYWKRKII